MQVLATVEALAPDVKRLLFIGVGCQVRASRPCDLLAAAPAAPFSEHTRFAACSHPLLGTPQPSAAPASFSPVPLPQRARDCAAGAGAAVC